MTSTLNNPHSSDTTPLLYFLVSSLFLCSLLSDFLVPPFFESFPISSLSFSLSVFSSLSLTSLLPFLSFLFLHEQRLSGENERPEKLTSTEQIIDDSDATDAGADDEKRKEKRAERENKNSEKHADSEKGKAGRMTMSRFLDNWRLNMSTRSAHSTAHTSGSSSSSSKHTSLRDINILEHDTCNGGSGSATPAALQSPRDGECSYSFFSSYIFLLSC